MWGFFFSPQQGGTFGPITHRDKDRKTLGTQHQVVCVCACLCVCWSHKGRVEEQK